MSTEAFGFVYRDNLLAQFPEIVGNLVSTTNLLVTVEGHHANAHADVAAAVADLTSLLQRFIGGVITSALIDAKNPAFPTK